MKNISLQTDNETLDPRSAYTLYLKEGMRATVDQSRVSRVTLILWGLAWLVGYGTLYIGALTSGEMPPAWAFWVFGICLVIALVGSTVIGVRSGQRVTGVSQTAGMLYGWAFAIAFVGVISMITVIVTRYDLSGEVTSVLYNSVSALIVGCLYMAGGAMWRDRTMYQVGVGMIVLGLVGALLGIPNGFLAMALVGGGLMLAQFGFETWRLRRMVRAAKEGQDD